MNKAHPACPRPQSFLRTYPLRAHAACPRLASLQRAFSPKLASPLNRKAGNPSSTNETTHRKTPCRDTQNNIFEALLFTSVRGTIPPHNSTSARCFFPLATNNDTQCKGVADPSVSTLNHHVLHPDRLPMCALHVPPASQ